MKPKIIKTFSKVPANIAKKLNLTFDKKFGYCISDAYKDDKGDYIKDYYCIDFKIYGLKYFDGCFNPYLVEYDPEGFAFSSYLHSENPKVIFIKNYTSLAIQKLREKYPKFSH